MRSLQSISYSKGSLSDIHSLIHHALDYAVYPAELISSNPANYIKVPKKAPTNIVKRHIITPKKLNELLEENPFGSPYYIPILILYHTGMRIGEVCGLTWNAIDFAKNIITLDKQIVHINNQGDYFSTLKTKTSKRIILIDDFLASELKRWKNQQAKNETTAGDSYANIYRADDNKLIQQSKGLGEVDAEKVNLVCTDESGRAVRKLQISNFFYTQRTKCTFISAHSSNNADRKRRDDKRFCLCVDCRLQQWLLFLNLHCRTFVVDFQKYV